MLKPKRARRIFSFYFFLLLTNFALFVYEVFIVKMMPEQSFVFRSVTLVTDFFEALIFLEYLKNLPAYILKFFHLNITCKWLLGGIKLALIGPNFYLLKLFLVNFALYRVDIGVPPLVINKIILAYTISLLSSFSFGSLWVLCIEKFFNKLINKIKSRCP
jgi:hypothetical protein